MGQVIRVLVVDDDPLVRTALSMMLDGAEGLTLVGELEDGDEVLPHLRSTPADVVLMDIRMRRQDGITTTEQVMTLPHPPGVLVLTTFDADDQLTRALRAGACGYVLKDTRPADLVSGGSPRANRCCRRALSTG